MIHHLFHHFLVQSSSIDDPKIGKSSILPKGDAPSYSHFSSKSEAFQGVPSGRLERYLDGAKWVIIVVIKVGLYL
jgi:hypothetical protein